MTDPDRETRAAIAEIARRLRGREPGTDDEVLALELITALRGRGWRPTEARPAPDWKRPRGSGRPPTDEWRQARAELGERLAGRAGDREAS